MANIFMMNEEIARGMVCFFHLKKHSYFIAIILLPHIPITRFSCARYDFSLGFGLRSVRSSTILKKVYLKTFRTTLIQKIGSWSEKVQYLHEAAGIVRICRSLFSATDMLRLMH
jgi:hypothetical protein